MIGFPSPEVQARYFPDTVPAGNVTLHCILGLDTRFRACRGSPEAASEYVLATYAAEMLIAEARAEPAMVNGVPVKDQLVSVQVTVAEGRRRAAAIAAANARVVPPSWRVMPPKETADRYFPDRAADSSTPGKALVSCLVNRDGAVRSCSIVSEEPAGMGFGEAAVLFLTKEARFNPQTKGGQPVDGGRIKLWVNFLLPE